METPTAKKWYDNSGLVVLLCVLFFPVGLYGLWKSPKFSKGLRAGITAVIAIFIIIAIASSDDEKNKTVNDSTTKTSEKETLPDVVVNSSFDGSVSQVKEYLKNNLKDWD